MKDSYAREIDYLRISVTDRCNLACIYCVPAGGIPPFAEEELLTGREIVRTATAAARLGITKVRITGGEPLLRKDLPALVASLRTIPGIDDISITTNGILLQRLAADLASAGLNRVNVSLDTLRPDRYRKITRGGDIHQVLEGILKAEQAGLKPIKINMIPLWGLNDDELEDFARLTLQAAFQVRFIEFMPIGSKELWALHRTLSSAEIQERILRIAPLTPVGTARQGPARYYRFSNASGMIGFISPMTRHFCGTCNRLRLTSDGKLRPCLFSEAEIDVRAALRQGASEEDLESLIGRAIEGKPRGRSICPGADPDHLRPIVKIGG